MEIIELLLVCITAPDWNSNQMDAAMRSRLQRSIERFGLVIPLVVRQIGQGIYETVGGAQRLEVLIRLGVTTASCVLVSADDTEARLLAQSLNRIAGEDDLGSRAELVRHLLAALPQQDILAFLPESVDSLRSLASLGKQDLAGSLQAWQKAQPSRLRHLTFQLTPEQLTVVEEALAGPLDQVKKRRPDGPNNRGAALYLMCQEYLNIGGKSHDSDQ